MDTIVLWQQKWGLSFNVPLYLFLGGVAGGTMTLGALADLLGGRRERFAAFARIAAYITIPAILVGGLALSLHLGKPERGFAFPLFFTNYQSWLTLGGWVVGAFAPLGCAYAAAWYLGWSRPVRRLLALAAVPLGVVMSLYTGFLLSAAWLVPADRWYVPLWDRRYLPALFVFSGLSTGFAACGLAALTWGAVRRWLAGAGPELRPVASVASLGDMVALAAEAGWLYYFLHTLAAGSTGQRLAYQLLTEGDLAPWFWWGFVATGLAAPLLAGVLHAVAERLFHVHPGLILYPKFVLVLVGGIVLRYMIVWGGDLKAPLIFPPTSWPVPTMVLPPIPGVGG